MDGDFVNESEAHMRLALELILTAAHQKLSYKARLQKVNDIAIEGLGGEREAEMVLAMTVWPSAGGAR